jgi:prevent-host-death family protein
MVAYTKNEMVGITELSRSLNSFVEKVKDNTIEKLAIMKNNKPEVVILSTDEYERIKAIADSVEYHAIADIIDERMPDGEIGKTITFEELQARMKKRGRNV